MHFLFYVLIEFKVDEQICSEVGQAESQLEKTLNAGFWVRDRSLLRLPYVPKIRSRTYGLKGARA